METRNSSVSYEITATLSGSVESGIGVSPNAQNVNILLPENFSVARAEQMEIVFRRTQAVRNDMYLVELDLSHVTAAGTYEVAPVVTVKEEWADCCSFKTADTIQVTVVAVTPKAANDA